METERSTPTVPGLDPNARRATGVDVEAPLVFISSQPPEAALAPAQASSARLKYFALFTLVLSGLFFKPLFELVRFSLHSELHSHLVLIPFISGYLVWLRRKEALPAPAGSLVLAVIPLAVGLLALRALRLGDWAASLGPNDHLALASFSFLCFLWAGALLLLGGKLLRALAFPALFLTFIVPLPSAAENAIEIFFQHASAEAAALLFAVSGSTLFRDGLVFQLPGITIQVAQECSGIRSSFVLFIVSLLAGYLFFQSPWRRAALTAFVIPLAILRNGFRIFTIGGLCVHVRPDMIDSPIHHNGGPLFFLLSLLPFFLLLVWLRRRERRAVRSAGSGAELAAHSP